jgi:hypothetical protein
MCQSHHPLFGVILINLIRHHHSSLSVFIIIVIVMIMCSHHHRSCEMVPPASIFPGGVDRQ